MTKRFTNISHREDAIGILLLVATLIAAMLLARLVAGAVIGLGAMIG